MITVAEAATIKKMSGQSIREAIREGRLKGRKSGGTYLVDKDSLEAYVKIGHRPKKDGDHA